MSYYPNMSASQLQEEAAFLQNEYDRRKADGLKLDLSRGKPDAEQLDLSGGMLNCIGIGDILTAEDGSDCRNYGALAGIPEARRLMAELLDAEPDEVFVGGNSSLNLMHDCVGVAYLHGLPRSASPWRTLPRVKFLCPSPGYDRHFAVTEHFGIEMIPVPMTAEGPDMDIVEQLAASDDAVKGMWCVPKYSNPTGITYSDGVVRRLAALTPAAPDFTIFWDNAYAVHDLYPDQPDVLLSLLGELKKTGKSHMALLFASTSKVTYAGGGIAAVAAGQEMLAHLQKHFALQTIGYDKVNQLRHVRFFSGGYTVAGHMRRHAALLRPKFTAVLQTLESALGGRGVATWNAPRGGYFVSLDTMPGCAKRVVALCKEAGVVMTPAGATFPYGIDPNDSNIRIAPTYATLAEVKVAAELLCLCVRIASVEKLLAAPDSAAG